jgi:hypothetical protein
MKITRDVASTLAEDLESLGYQATHESRQVTIRLPLFCSVRVLLHENGITLTPMFGAVSRTVATFITAALIFAFLVIAAAANANFAVSNGYALVVLSLYIIIWGIYRYVLTESAANVVRYWFISHDAS